MAELVPQPFQDDEWARGPCRDFPVLSRRITGRGIERELRQSGEDAVASERLVRATWVLVRRDGGWRIACYHNSPAR